MEGGIWREEYEGRNMEGKEECLLGPVGIGALYCYHFDLASHTYYSLSKTNEATPSNTPKWTSAVPTAV